MEKSGTACKIHVGSMHYRTLSALIYEQINQGFRRFVLQGVIGQRYIGAGLGHDVEIDIIGVPGQDLAVFNGGARIRVFGNAQDGVGNTMNDGYITVHGSVGDIPGHMVRNGRIYIEGSAGFRAGIMMKEYGSKSPVMIVGERIGDYVGEYMAGGTIVVLGYSLDHDESPVAHHVASGMFGGKIFVRGLINEDQLGRGALMRKADRRDLESVYQYLVEFAEEFDLDIQKIIDVPFTVITRAGERPYGNLYVPSSKISRDLIPVHRNITPPCAHACPIGIPNPVIIRKLKEGKVEEAFDLIDDFTPFRYSCCGMICPGLCRAACTRNNLDDAVKIDEIARQYHPTGTVQVIEGKKEETVCVIGSGPAGLTAAWHLARRGYAVDVYEKEDDIGGKLVHNIPEERLPRQEVDRDLSRIRSLGIRFITGKEVDAELFRSLQKRYNAVVLAVGAQKPRTIGFTGEQDAVSSFHFLRSVKVNDGIRLDDKAVVIIGAGNVTMDAACESFRLGARSVTAIDVQKPAAYGKELDHALGLGLKVLYPRFVDRYTDGKLFLKNGETLDADLLIESIGEIPELDFVGESIVLDGGSFTTNIPGVYVIGDAAAPGLVTHSIGMGKNVALTIHSLFRGIPEQMETEPVVDKSRINLVYFEGEDVLFNDLDACFSCGTCIQCDICVENCPRQAIERIGENFQINYDVCSGCGVCASVCPRGAIIMEPKQPGKGETAE